MTIWHQQVAQRPLQVDEVVDSVVISLSKFAGVLHPGSPKSVAAFGESEKARAAVEAMFLIANRSVLYYQLCMLKGCYCC